MILFTLKTKIQLIKNVLILNIKNIYKIFLNSIIC